MGKLITRLLSIFSFCITTGAPLRHLAKDTVVIKSLHNSNMHSLMQPLHVRVTPDALQDAEKQQLQEQQAAFMSEVEEWSQGEVEAIQAAAAARLDDEQRQGQQW